MDLTLPSFVFEPFEPVHRIREAPRANHLLSYLKGEEKYRYQQQIPKRIRPYLLNHIASLKEEVDRCVDNEVLSAYLFNLDSAWRGHNRINGLIDWFLFVEHLAPFKDWSLQEWQTARDLLVAAIEVDHRKNVYSGGIKRKVEKEAQNLRSTLSLSENEASLLLTPASGTFFSRYFLEHAEYHLVKTWNKAEVAERRHKLAEKYHCGDEKLLEIRIKDINLEGCDERELKRTIETFRVRLRQLFVEKIYFMIGREAVKQIDRLLEFDNLLEYLWVYNFKGFPDVLLRDEICRRLKLAHRLPESADSLSIKPAELLSLVDDYIEHRRFRYLIRMRPYLQNYTTCGACCVISFLEKKGLTPTLNLESQIWERVGKPFNFPGGMAKILIENGFNVVYYQYPAEQFTPGHEDVVGRDPFIYEKIKEYVVLHKEAVAAGMDVVITDWGYQEVRKQLESGNPCILGIQLSSTILHWVIVRGYRGNRLETIDPLGRIKSISEGEMDRLIQTSMGKRLLVVEKFPPEFLGYLKNQIH